MFAVPEHAAEFIESANLEAEGITKLDLGENLIRGYVSEVAEALEDKGVKELNMTRTGISEAESIEFVEAIVRGVGIEKLAIDHSDTPAFNHTVTQLGQEKMNIVSDTLQEIAPSAVPHDLVNLIGGYDEGIEICSEDHFIDLLP
jgi:hypothetical protein